MRVTYHPLVQKDYQRAVSYYEQESHALALRFDTAFEKGIRKITEVPTAYSFYLTHSVYRRFKLDRFPYVIVYRVTAVGIRVVMLKHEKQRPSYGMNRQ